MQSSTAEELKTFLQQEKVNDQRSMQVSLHQSNFS